MANIYWPWELISIEDPLPQLWGIIRLDPSTYAVDFQGAGSGPKAFLYKLVLWRLYHRAIAF